MIWAQRKDLVGSVLSINSLGVYCFFSHICWQFISQFFIFYVSQIVLFGFILQLLSDIFVEDFSISASEHLKDIKFIEIFIQIVDNDKRLFHCITIIDLRIQNQFLYELTVYAFVFLMIFLAPKVFLNIRKWNEFFFSQVKVKNVA